MNTVAEKLLPTIMGSESAKAETYRLAPYNIQAEQAVLGAVLVNNDSLNRVAEYLTPELFYEPVHMRIYDAILKIIDRGLVATPVTLKNYFDKDQALVDIGGAEYLARLAGKATAILNLEAYGRLIYDLAVRRQLVGIGEDIVNNAYDNEIEQSARQQIEIAEQKLFTLASEGSAESGFVVLRTSLNEAIRKADIAHKRDEKLSGVTSGFKDLDGILAGMQASDLIILAGRPSMGKTALAVNIAMEACKSLVKNFKSSIDTPHPPAVGFFSLEMSSEQLAARMIAMESGVDSSKMRAGTLRDEEFAQIVESNRKLYNLPFFIDDTPALSISALRTRARRLKRKNNLGLVIIDYLQLVRGVSKVSEGSRVQEVSEVTQGLKAIAKELNIPVVALSQLSRAVEQREDKRPQLSDLRESGSIEQDADVVMFIYREEYYESRKEPPADSPKYSEWQDRMSKCHNLTEVIVAKQRNGPIGTARLFFNSNTTKFEDLAEDYNRGFED